MKNVIAALPGTYALTFDKLEPHRPMREPIIGWCVSDANAMPVTIAMDINFDAVLFPCGMVVQTDGDALWESVAAWVESMKARPDRPVGALTEIRAQS